MDDSKSALRAEAGKRRSRMAKAGGPAAAHRMAEHFLNTFALVSGEAVALYWPVRGELDTRPLMEMLTARGITVALPVVVRAGGPLVFRPWSVGQPLVDGQFGIKVPTEHAGTVRPEIVGAPLLAFDEDGHRLGYGGGFYDRTLEALRADERQRIIAVGLGFEQQRVARLPRHEGDQRLDMVITDHGVHRIGRDCL